VNRTTYLLAQGRPAAQIGVYIPSSSFWFGDTAVNRSFLAIVHALLEHQRDVDFVDDFSIAQRMELRGAELVNRSGQSYRAIIVPPAVALSKAALDRLHAFATAGGKVIFLGGLPQLVVDKNFLSATAPSRLDWAMVESTAEVTPAVLDALPSSDVSLDQPTSALKYNHRHVRDGEIYFFFNEGENAVNAKATIATGNKPGARVEQWDANSGKIEPLAGAADSGHGISVPLSLAPWATKLVMIVAGPR
jgi:hypothetical protein